MQFDTNIGQYMNILSLKLMLEAAKMDQRKDLSLFDKSQIVIAR